jgi:hypothetical protein
VHECESGVCNNFGNLLMKKIERDNLLIRACVFALKFKCSSKWMPSSLKDLRLGLA